MGYGLRVSRYGLLCGSRSASYIHVVLQRNICYSGRAFQINNLVQTFMRIQCARNREFDFQERFGFII